MRRTVNGLMVGSVLTSLTLGPSALAAGDQSSFDLTGTWEGTVVCDELFAGGYLNYVAVDDPILLVQDSRDHFRMVFRQTDPEGTGNNEEFLDLVYEGKIQEVQDSKQREAIAGVCGGDYTANELVRLRRITVSADGASFDAESVFFTSDFPGFEGSPDFLTCNWAYDRVSTEPPDVPRCSFRGLRQ